MENTGVVKEDIILSCPIILPYPSVVIAPVESERQMVNLHRIFVVEGGIDCSFEDFLSIMKESPSNNGEWKFKITEKS